LSITTPSTPLHHKFLILPIFLLLVTLLVPGCAPTAGQAQQPSQFIEEPPTSLAAVSVRTTPTFSPEHNSRSQVTAISPTFVLPSPSHTDLPSPTPTNTPLPSAKPILDPLLVFTSSILRKEVVPQGYLDDECVSMKLRWSGSPPHTVVVPIMFHSIVKDGRTVQASHDISEAQFADFVQYAQGLGFNTITTAQLEDFLYQNAPIPERSMILIVDDRRPGVIRDHFLPILIENNWTVTLGWISAGNGPGLWAQMEDLNETGYLDIQAHGYHHKYITSTMPEEEIWEEISSSIPLLEEHFREGPRAYIWPGGNYTSLAIQIAREAGYRLGFTVHSPVPIRFNWIPLVPASVEMNDPLMVLPRAWSNEANYKLNQALKVAEEAKAFAIDNYDREAAWFRSVCRAELPPLDIFYPDTDTP
jgi:peptidoglycan/xylan/chitin deacetylase (PgdA/CDA1 family)